MCAAEVDVDHAKRFSQFGILQIHPAKRHGLVEGGQRIAECAVPFARDEHEGGIVRLNVLRLTDLPQMDHDLLDGDAPEIEALAPRENRGKNLVRLGRGKDEEGVGRWFFQRLQQRIERLLRQHVNLIHDVDLLSAALRRDPHGLSQLPDVVYLVVGCRIDFDDAQTPAFFEGAAGLADAARFRRVFPLFEGRGAVDGLRQYAGDRRLAHPAGPREQVGMRQPVEPDGILQRFRNVFLRDQLTEDLGAVLTGGDQITLRRHRRWIKEVQREGRRSRQAAT